MPENNVRITATIMSVIFNKDSFAIFSVMDKKTNKKISAKGNIINDASSLVGHDVVFEGLISETKFGEQMNFSHYAVVEGVSYFWDHVAKIPTKSRDSIVSRFGVDPNWLNGDKNEVIKKLHTVPGVKEKTTKRILENWEEYQDIKKLMEVVSVFGISQAQAIKIYEHFKEKASLVVSMYPYQLTEVNGIGFRKADEIAMRVGISERDASRYVAALQYIMETLIKEGSTAINEASLFNSINELIVMSDGELAFRDLNSMRSVISNPRYQLNNPVVYIDKETLTLKSYLSMEGYILEKLKSSHNHRFFCLSEKEATEATKKNKNFSTLGDQQKEMVMSALSSGSIFGIFGFAGTGKTTTSKILLNIIEYEFGLEQSDIVGCAVAGVAASRIKTQSGYNAYTIHSLLKYNPDSCSWFYNQDNKLEYKVVILDEAGMVDTYLFYSLLRAIDFTKTKLILLGDTAQLPPVGAGQILIDIVDNNLIPYKMLTKIYRQSEDKAINAVAESVRNGVRPPVYKTYTDVFSYGIKGKDNIDINRQIEEQIIKISSSFMPLDFDKLHNKEDILDYLYNFQVLTPRKTGTLSRESLNKAIRTLFMSGQKELFHGTEYPISIGEKMIHLSNADMKTTHNSAVRVYNGMIGIVTNLDTENDSFTVYYPLEGYSVIYTERQIKSGLIGYGWCLTIHKTQGSEFNNIVIPFSNSHWNMLNSKITYTGITRAKQECHLVGTVKAFHQACTNKDSMIRKTVIQTLLSTEAKIDKLQPVVIESVDGFI